MDSNLKQELDELKLRIKAVLRMCNNREQILEYSVATDSVKTMLTDCPIERLKED